MTTAWVFHRGALGDSVLLWPRLRVLRADGYSVTLVTDASKGRLAARELGIACADAESARFSALWREGASVVPVEGVALVVDHVGAPSRDFGGSSAKAPPDSAQEHRTSWHINLARMFPGARIESAAPPTGAVAREFSERDPRALPARRENPGGPVVMHVGAGSEDKRWPMERWLELATMARDRGGPGELIAGEVEAERLARGERAAFEAAGGRFLHSLDELADVVSGARVFVGSDSGPTHLAAQLGVATVALFGPTDPGVWGPVGPAVSVLTGPAESHMTLIEWESVAARIKALACPPLG